MKATALEIFRIVESILFWAAALSLALIAFPALALADKATRSHFRVCYYA